MGFIYKVTNQINGKVYIGKTEQSDPYERWKEHQKDRVRRKMEKRPFYCALNKYGVENFKFEVIDQEDDPEKLCELEIYYINKYRSFVGFKDCNGYNATLGGDTRSYLQLDEQEVIKIHIQNDYIAGRTAKYFKVDPGSIQKILKKHNISWLSSKEITEKKFKEKYGGLVQLNHSCSKIIHIFNTPKEAYTSNPLYKEKTLTLAYLPCHKTHHAYSYTWYRLNELPEQYKPLLEEYYKEHPELKENK